MISLGAVGSSEPLALRRIREQMAEKYGFDPGKTAAEMDAEFAAQLKAKEAGFAARPATYEEVTEDPNRPGYTLSGSLIAGGVADRAERDFIAAGGKCPDGQVWRDGACLSPAVEETPSAGTSVQEVTQAQAQEAGFFSALFSRDWIILSTAGVLAIVLAKVFDRPNVKRPVRWWEES